MKRVCKFKTVIAVSFVMSLFVVLACADVGTSGWDIFSKIHSAQFSGISSAAPSHADISGALYNPAILGTINERELTFSSEQGLADDVFGSLIYGEPLHNGMIAAGFAYYDAGVAELNWLDNNGVLNTQNVTAERDMMGFVSFQHQASKLLSWGVNLKAGIQ